MKKLIVMLSSTLALLASASAANATVSGSVMLCDAHDWERFAEALNSQNQAELDAMASDPELRNCEFITTVIALTCANTPAMCPPPVVVYVPARDILYSTLPGEGPFPGQRPGEQAGGNGGNGGNGDNPDVNQDTGVDAPQPDAAPSPAGIR